MENGINVAELLKYCPSGMPLDCTMWDNLYFDRVEDDLIHCYYELDGYRNTTMFLKDGCYTAHKLSKCVIFPKDKTTWEGFVPPCKFKDGDIIFTHTNASKGLLEDSWVSIFKEYRNNRCACYACLCLSDLELYHDKFEDELLCELCEIGENRLATEDEKEKLFKAIKENGYEWYQDTKCLVKLFKPNFKAGDRIRNKTDKYLADRTIASYVEGIGYFTTINDWVRINEQDNWELVPVVKPLYKVGDRIKQKNGNTKVIILLVDDWKYIIKDSEGICGILSISTQDNWELDKNIKPIFKIGDIIKKKDDNRLITIKSILYGNYIITTPDLFDNCNLTDKLSFEHQDEYELVKRNKFNFSTLKPFDKVLVRDGNNETWVNAFFGFRDSETYKKCTFVTGNENWCQCIPYEGNEHLLGTTNDCEEHFKIW